MDRLTNFSPGQRIRVLKVRGPGEIHRRLRHRGITIGCEIEIGITNAAKTVVMVKTGGGIFFPLSHEVAEGVYAEPVAAKATEKHKGNIMTELGGKEANFRCSPLKPVSEEGSLCR
jgi:Fe2+ transport system protein FeoA